MNWSGLGYALFCLAAPMAWGLLVVWASNAIERRVRRDKPQGSADEVPPIDYHI